jgi:short-subunit dehydrogenase
VAFSAYPRKGTSGKHAETAGSFYNLMAKRELQGGRALITGASSGIGREIAREMARHGARLLLVARRVDRLAELAAELSARGAASDSGGARVEILAGDVTDPAVRQAAIQTAQQVFGGLDILVNNAGIGAVGPFAEADPQRLRRIMEVNFFAPVEMIRSALPLLQQGRRPIIVNISSILGLRGIPYSSEYCASKFALEGFSQALRLELHRAGIEVLVVCPGTTDTEFFDRVIERTMEPPWPHRPIPPAVVARRTVRAIRRGSRRVIVSGGAKLLYWLDRFAPPLVDHLLLRFM